MRSIYASLAIAAAVMAGPQMSAQADPSLECSVGNGSQVEIGGCVAAQEAVVDKAVELALGFALSAAQELDKETGRAVAADALGKGQAAWTAYRDQHCEFVGATFGGGSGTGIAIMSCRVSLGRARVEELMLYAR